MSDVKVNDAAGRPERVLARRLAVERGWAWTRVRELQPGHVQVFCGRAMTVASVTLLGPRLALVRYLDAPSMEWSGSTKVPVTSA